MENRNKTLFKQVGKMIVDSKIKETYAENLQLFIDEKLLKMSRRSC